MKLEIDNLHKSLYEIENYTVKKLQDDLDDLKQMNQLYRSQKLELEEENELLIKEKDRIKQDFNQLINEK